MKKIANEEYLLRRGKAHPEKENTQPTSPTISLGKQSQRTPSVQSLGGGPVSAAGPAPPSLEEGLGGCQDSGVFSGEMVIKPRRLGDEKQAKFEADLCRLLIISNIAWWTVEQPYW